MIAEQYTNTCLDFARSGQGDEGDDGSIVRRRKKRYRNHTESNRR
jgi:hypothetical protein